jgi:hypothetical protein
MYDPFSVSWSKYKCNLDETHSIQKNEVFCQNGLWSFAKLFPKYVLLENLWNAPRQFQGLPDMVFELLGTV